MQIIEVAAVLIFQLACSWAYEIIGNLQKNGSFVPEVPQASSVVMILRVRDKKLCGGALVGDRWVGTSASCVVKKNNVAYPPAFFRVFPGKIEVLKGHKNKTIGLPVVNIFVNLNYTAACKFGHDDIALLLIEPNKLPGVVVASISQDASYITHYNKTKQCKIFGWDFTNVRSASKLLNANITLLNASWCHFLTGGEAIEGRTFCLDLQYVSQSGHPFLCKGDDGGPVVCDGMMVGLTGGLCKCDLHHQGRIVMTLGYYYPWIQSVLESLSSSLRSKVSVVVTSTLLSCAYRIF